MTAQEACVIHRDSFKDVAHSTQFTGDKHQMFYYFSISCIVMLMAPHLYNKTVFLHCWFILLLAKNNPDGLCSTGTFMWMLAIY
jgi:hypothetical protein